MRSSNPLLRQDTFNRFAYLTGADPSTLMTVEGSLNRALMLFGILLASAVAGAALAFAAPGIALISAGLGFVIGFVIAVVLAFKREMAPTLSPAYAVAEGLAVGVISYMFSLANSGIVVNALILTISILGLMLLCYRSGVIRATPAFMRVISFAIGGIAITYLANFVMRLFGQSIPMVHESSPLGIGFSLLCCGVASLTFIADFAFIEKGAEQGAPKYMEWYAGFSLLVTLVWLYLEILRLLAKLRR